ncbi:MAG TPA: 4-hydroxybenzoate octaprenyltransferase [Steroidobacteraceae bacterium]
MAEDLGPQLELAPRRPRAAPFSYRVMRRVIEYGRLARLDRPIGIWLLLWPVLWALWIAASGRPAPRVLIVFVLGVFTMRAAGCVINDLVDRNIDPRIRRTRQRPLAARRVTPHEAIVLFVVLAAAALWLVLQLNALTIRLSLVGAGLTVSYPFVKRLFPLPQLYLGISFGGWGVPMAFAAQTGQVPRIAWVIFMAAVVWAVIYDTLYAMVDREDDLKIGVRSTAIAFADMDRAMIGLLQLLMLAALALAGRTLHFGNWYYGALGVAAATFVYQQCLIRHRDPDACLRGFLNNNYTGVAIFAGILLQYLYGT